MELQFDAAFIQEEFLRKSMESAFEDPFGRRIETMIECGWVEVERMIECSQVRIECS